MYIFPNFIKHIYRATEYIDQITNNLIININRINDDCKRKLMSIS